MAMYQLACPSCGTELACLLEDEVTEITGPCGFKFLAQRPAEPKKKKKPPPPPLSLSLLERADDVTSAAVIELFKKVPEFKAFSKAEMEGILARDAEDDEKLAAGIKLAVKKGAVPAKIPLEPITTIDVLGKSADRVAGEIVSALGDAPSTGCVLILQGLSGTGKGTTVDKLKAMLPRAQTWSNGNIFRSLTLLAVTYCESHGLPFSGEALTPELLRDLIGMLTFERLPEPPAAAAREEGVHLKWQV